VAEKLPTGTLTTRSASRSACDIALDAGIEGAVEHTDDGVVSALESGCILKVDGDDDVGVQVVA
jgi:hypothetical protein